MFEVKDAKGAIIRLVKATNMHFTDTQIWFCNVENKGNGYTETTWVDEVDMVKGMSVAPV